MSEHTEDPSIEPAVEDALDDNEPEPEPADPDTGDDGKAKYRRRAQAAETERDELRTQLDTARRGIIEDACGLTRPAALWAAGVDPNTLFGDDGQLDHDKLTAAVTDAADRLGLTRAPRTPKPDPSAGSASGTTGSASWGAIFERK